MAQEIADVVVRLLVRCEKCGPDTVFETCPSLEGCGCCDEEHPEFDGEAHPTHHPRCVECVYVPEGVTLESPAGTELECQSWIKTHQLVTGHAATLVRVHSKLVDGDDGPEGRYGIEKVV